MPCNVARNAVGSCAVTVKRSVFFSLFMETVLLLVCIASTSGVRQQNNASTDSVAIDSAALYSIVFIALLPWSRLFVLYRESLIHNKDSEPSFAKDLARWFFRNQSICIQPFLLLFLKCFFIFLFFFKRDCCNCWYFLLKNCSFLKTICFPSKCGVTFLAMPNTRCYALCCNFMAVRTLVLSLLCCLYCIKLFANSTPIAGA